MFCKDRTDWVDYKDINLLRRFTSDRGKIRARRVSGNCAQHQRDVAVAIKTARELAFLPYTQRTVAERGGGRGRGRGGDAYSMEGGSGRPSANAPLPASPPPPPGPRGRTDDGEDPLSDLADIEAAFVDNGEPEDFGGIEDVPDLEPETSQIAAPQP